MKTSREILLNKRAIKETCYIIYALIDKDTIVYIGQTRILPSRLGQHLKSAKRFDSWSVVENLGADITPKEVNSIESNYIKKLKPKYNKALNPIKRKRKKFDKNKSYAKEIQRRYNIARYIRNVPELENKFKKLKPTI